jgi:hypothetical protein
LNFIIPKTEQTATEFFSVRAVGEQVPYACTFVFIPLVTRRNDSVLLFLSQHFLKHATQNLVISLCTKTYYFSRGGRRRFPRHMNTYCHVQSVGSNETGNVQITSDGGAYVQRVFPVEKQLTVNVFCSPSYPSCNAHAPYCHLWPCPALPYFFHIIS